MNKHQDSYLWFMSFLWSRENPSLSNISDCDTHLRYELQELGGLASAW